MEFDYKIIEKEQMTLIGFTQVLSEGQKEDLYSFFDSLLRDGRYQQLFSAQFESSGEWNIYTSNEQIEGSGKYLFMVATEFNQNLDFSKLHGMKLDIMHIKPAKWLTVKTHSFEEMDNIHKKAIQENCIKEIGYKLDFDYQKPIMEFQSEACTKTPSFIEFWMPVVEI